MTHDGHDVTSQPGLLTCWQHGGVKGLFQYRAGLVQEVLRPYCSWGSWRCGNDRCGRGDFEFSHEDKHSSSMLSLHMFLHHKEVDYELGWGGCKTVSCWEYAALWAMGVMWHAGLTRCPADGNNVPAEAKSRTNTDYSIGDFSNLVCVICWHRAWKSIFMRSLNCRNVQPEHEWRNTTATEGHGNRKYVKNWRFESLTPPHLYRCCERLRAQIAMSRRCAFITLNRAAAMAAMMNSKWTRLYLWELSKSGHAIGRGQCSIFRRLLKLSLGYHVWITKSLNRLFNHLIMRVAAERYRNLLLCSICEDKKVKEVKLFFWFLIVR